MMALLKSAQLLIQYVHPVWFTIEYTYGPFSCLSLVSFSFSNYRYCKEINNLRHRMTRTCHFIEIKSLNKHVKILKRAGRDVCAVAESCNPQRRPLEWLNVASLPIKYAKYCDIMPHITAFVLSKQQEPSNSRQGMQGSITADTSTCTLSRCDRPDWT